ncbi:MAG: peptide deformylase [Anaerolineae bacterium]|jgi:peptide deformylase|nr:peptide deformylase [Anaerolineae bacterium]
MKKRILMHPEEEKALRTPSQAVTRVDKKIKALIQDLKDTLAQEAGVGLAAPQIGVHKRVVVIKLGQKHDADDQELGPTFALINPEIVSAEGEQRDYDACLSIPGLYGYTYRPQKITVKAWDEHGQAIQLDLEDLDARVVLHEVDHLDGILFLDRLRSQEDLYVVTRDKKGRLVHTPIKEILKSSGG